MSRAPEGPTLDALIRQIVRSELRSALAEVAPAPQAADDYLGTREAARYAKIAPGTLRRWIREGRVTACHAGRYHRVKRADLDRALRSSEGDDGSPEVLARAAFRSLR